jgi:hypothetical protein
MKTNYFKKAVNVCMLVCAMCFVASVNNVKSQTLAQKYYYDSNRELTLNAPTRTICKPDESGKYLVPHLKYFFTYDESGRVVKKEAHRWNSGSKSWEQSYILNISHEEACMTLDYAKWDKEELAYASNKERAVYTMQNEEVVSYAYFKQIQNDEEWILVADIPEIQQNILFIADMVKLQIDPLSIMNGKLLAVR